ncbi:hypothetical protein N431DRAFT_129959 [Stipitochalara longipes BDJ]|nr:hypothetical protein N431DRAFT_129959 [Stipitochalara longipes BDJ]
MMQGPQTPDLHLPPQEQGLRLPFSPSSFSAHLHLTPRRDSCCSELYHITFVLVICFLAHSHLTSPPSSPASGTLVQRQLQIGKQRTF